MKLWALRDPRKKGLGRQWGIDHIFNFYVVNNQIVETLLRNFEDIRKYREEWSVILTIHSCDVASPDLEGLFNIFQYIQSLIMFGVKK